MISSQNVRDLLDVGFIAWSRGMDREAARIFEAVRLLRPNREAGYIGVALVRLRAGDAAGAAAILEKLPPSNTARAFLGLALLRLGDRDRGMDMLRDVIDHARDDPAGRLASSILGEQSADRALA